jgi:putative FmdB family regulatory protein
LPIYEYRCAKGHQYEQAEGFDAPTEQSCPHCGGRARRRISLPAVIFKGRGFYSTDNREASSGDNGGSGGGPSEDHGHSDEDSGSKTEAAAD